MNETVKGKQSSDDDEQGDQNISIKSKQDSSKISTARLYRKNSIKLERMKRHDRMKRIIYPEDKCKSYWDIWITFILLITCIILPARIAFIKP